MEIRKFKDRLFLSMKYWPLMMLYTLMSHPVVARDLESIATNLTSRSSKVAMIIVPFGFTLAGVFMLFGSPKGAMFASGTGLAAFLILGGESIVNWMKGIVG